MHSCSSWEDAERVLAEAQHDRKELSLVLDEINSTREARDKRQAARNDVDVLLNVEELKDYRTQLAKELDEEIIANNDAFRKAGEKRMSVIEAMQQRLAALNTFLATRPEDEDEECALLKSACKELQAEIDKPLQ